MNNWLVTLINTVEPFDRKEVVVHADTIIDAFDEKNHGHPTYSPRSARYHSNNTDNVIGYLDKLVNIT